MKGTLRIVRGGEVKITLPASAVEVRQDGTLWDRRSGYPILGLPDRKTELAAYVRAKQYDKIPPEAYTRLGDNPNGLWAGDDELWAAHPLKAVLEAQAAAAAEVQRKTPVTIYLSSRGWGDYSPVEWTGDITRPDAEIMAECRARLAAGHDVDTPNPTDADLLSKIAKARATWAAKPEREAAEQAEVERKQRTGYCWHCEGYCYGDCGSNGFDDTYEGYVRREVTRAHQEASYGLGEEA